MELWYFQKGFNFSQDGPGNRLVYHLCGCNLRCPWCSNPEGMRRYEGYARSATVDQILRELLSARAMFFEGGGVTLTGGEATLQFDAVLELLKRARAEGIDTCMETNATHPRFHELLPWLNTLIADFKHPDDEAHRRWTGEDASRIRENLRIAAASGIPLQLRVPLIHGVNDDDQALAGFVSFFSQLQRPKMTVEFLRYHEYGKDKWKKLGLEYAMHDAFVAEQRAVEFEQACREAGVAVVRT